MATPTLGTTLRCFEDFTPLFKVAETNTQIVLDEVYHRLTNDRVLPPGKPETDNWGHDVRQYAGRAMSDSDVRNLGPKLAGVLQQSERLESADVTVTKRSIGGGLTALDIDVTARPATGTVFTYKFLLTPDTFELVGNTER